jgi:ABC-type transporter Mla maintaining outer membrane lipid asymmetry permease subunit MlaE
MLVTIGGIMSGFMLVPEALGTAHVAMPSWLYLVCIFVGTLGPVVIGVGAKGQDEHSTLDQVQKATEVQKVETPAPPVNPAPVPPKP